MTWVRNLWPFTGEGFLAYHTYCETRCPFRMVKHLWGSTTVTFDLFSNGAETIYFYDLRLSRMGFEHPNFRMRGERSNRLRHQCCFDASMNYRWTYILLLLHSALQLLNVKKITSDTEFLKQNVEHCMTSIRVSTRCISFKRKVWKSTDTRCWGGAF